MLRISQKKSTMANLLSILFCFSRIELGCWDDRDSERVDFSRESIDGQEMGYWVLGESIYRANET